MSEKNMSAKIVLIIHLNRKGTKHWLKNDAAGNWCFDDIWLGKETRKEKPDDSRRKTDE